MYQVQTALISSTFGPSPISPLRASHDLRGLDTCASESRDAGLVNAYAGFFLILNLVFLIVLIAVLGEEKSGYNWLEPPSHTCLRVVNPAVPRQGTPRLHLNSSFIQRVVQCSFVVDRYQWEYGVHGLETANSTRYNSRKQIVKVRVFTSDPSPCHRYHSPPPIQHPSAAPTPTIRILCFREHLM